MFSNRTLATSIGLLFLALSAVLGVLLNLASPGPAGQELLGLVIGSYDSADGVVLIPGRQLDCQPLAETEAYNAACTFSYNGETINLLAARNPPDHPMQLSGTCSASFNGASLGCEIGSPFVHTSWFAYVPQPDSFSSADMAQLRSRFFLNNQSESFFMGLTIAWAVATAVIGLWVVWAWIRPLTHNKRILKVASLIPVSALFFVVGLVSVLRFTSNFFD